jgi:hypothetical protein
MLLQRGLWKFIKGLMNTLRACAAESFPKAVHSRRPRRQIRSFRPAEETFLAALFVRTVSLAVVVAFPRMPIGSWADGLV